MKTFRRTEETKHLRYGEDIGLQATILTYIYTYQWGLKDHCRDDNCRKFLQAICKRFENSDYTRFQVYTEMIDALMIVQKHRGLVMDFASVEPLRNLFGEPFVWYKDDVHYNFTERTIIYPSEITKQKMRVDGINYKDIWRSLSREWSEKKYVYYPVMLTKDTGYGSTYQAKDMGDYESLPPFGENERGYAIW